MDNIQIINPATGTCIATYDSHSDQQVKDIIDTADKRYRSYSRLPHSRRADLLLSLADRLTIERESLATLMTLEMGKTLDGSRAEVDKCIWVCKYYATHAKQMLADEHIATEGRQSYIAYRPLGVILGVMPWN